LNYLEANLSLLATHQPELASRLKEIPVKNVKVFSAASGLPAACYERDSASLALHSRYDPLREARQNLTKYDCSGVDYFIFLGFGLGYLLDALLEKHPDSSHHYFIVEPELEILKAAFEARSLKHILSHPHVHFAWPAAGTELAEQWRAFFDPVYAKKSIYITHPPCVSLNAGLFKTAAEMIQSQTYQIFTDINTLVAKSREFLGNFVKNIGKSARSPGVEYFTGMFSGVPAVIVSAGPSLDKNIYELRGFEENMLIISADTALKPLMASGIEPHFVMTGDPSHANYLHLKDSGSKQALLVAEATSFPSAFDEFNERTISCIYENSSLHSLTDLLKNKGMLRAWGSVATMALDFALVLRCNPIIFVGQDLAYTGGIYYCSGVYFETDWFAGIADHEGWQARLKNIRSGRNTIMVEDIFGKPVESTDKLISYWNWIVKVFKSHPEVTFINATEGGILRDARIANLKETLYRHCRKNLNLRERVINGFFKAKENVSFGCNDLAVMFQELQSLENVLATGLKLCKRDGTAPRDLEIIKESIYKNPHLAPLLDSLNQMGNVTFLRNRHAHSSSKDKHLIPEIKNIYSEYFSSVLEALNIIKSALVQIEKQSTTGSQC
jgi:hypothetical protein